MTAPLDPNQYCMDEVRRFDHDRYLCALTAPDDARPHVFAFYAFNLEIARIREVVTEPMIGQIRLQWWRDVIAEIGQGKVRTQPIVQALAAAMKSSAPPKPEHFERLLTTREFDLGDTPPATLEELEDYAEGTSSTLVAATLDILNVHDADAAEAGRHVGIAWALIGLLRALPFHAQHRRLYLPMDLLQQAGIDPDSMFEGRAATTLRPVMETIVRKAEGHLVSARASRVPETAVPALVVATLADSHCRRFRRSGFDPFSPELQKPATLSALRVGWAAWRKRF
jgi:NADH dehydrogenase [ubiquinone] 1 alpha subcomplex assembly factor 6